MTTLSTRAGPALAAMAALALAAPALARDHPAIRISQAWCPAPPPGAPTAAGYLTVTNNGERADRLLGGASPTAAEVQIHSMSTQGGVMRMRPVTEGVEVGAGTVLPIQPGGAYHLMLIGLKQPLRVGQTVPVTLSFARAGKIDVSFVVRPQGAAPPGKARVAHGNMAGMHMGGR